MRPDRSIQSGLGPDEGLGARLAAQWKKIAPRMADLPIYNPRLEIHATAFRRHAPWTIGVVTTPWFMNVVAVPDEEFPLPAPGASVALVLPAGKVDAFVSLLDGFGRIAAASLFSPMDEFDDPAVARAVAESALDALFEAEVPLSPVTSATPVGVGRRGLFGGGRDRDASRAAEKADA